MGLIPIYAHAVFHGGTGAAGLIASAQGTGAIAGGITITVLANRFARSMLVGRLAVLLVLSLVAYALAPTLGWAAGCACVLGAASSATMITSTSMIQRDAPAHARGRVMSIMHSALGVSYGIGLLFIGGIADLVNLRVAFCVGAALMLAGFSLLVVRSRHWRAAFDGDRVLTTPSLATC
jgi:MFS family permease